jgi:hypothetical protein
MSAPLLTIAALAALAAAGAAARSSGGANQASGVRASREPAYVEPRVPPGYFDRPEVVAAGRVAADVLRAGHLLGTGNFGQVFGHGQRAVKVPAHTNMRGDVWSKQNVEPYLIHEAGVANELAARGHSVVPTVVLTRTPDGTLALLRELGAPPGVVTAAELGQIEAQLEAVEADGWDVDDELAVFRRQDGSLFVADVGWWRPRLRPRGSSPMDASDLPSLLYYLARTLGHNEDTQRALSATSSIPDEEFIDMLRGVVDPDDVIVELFREDYMPDMVESAERRRAVGLPVPDRLARAISAIQQQLDRLGRTTAHGLPRSAVRKLKRTAAVKRGRRGGAG